MATFLTSLVKIHILSELFLGRKTSGLFIPQSLENFSYPSLKAGRCLGKLWCWHGSGEVLRCGVR